MDEHEYRINDLVSFSLLTCLDFILISVSLKFSKWLRLDFGQSSQLLIHILQCQLNDLEHHQFETDIVGASTLAPQLVASKSELCKRIFKKI